MAFMMGLYPPGSAANMTQTQAQNAVPPFPVDNLTNIQNSLGLFALPNDFQTVPIHSDSGNYETLIFRGFMPSVCPIIKEMQMYQMLNNT